MPFQCSSQRRRKCQVREPRRSRRLARSRTAFSVGLVERRPRIFVSAPTFSEIDIRLSFSTTRMFGSGFRSPAWFSASNAMPAVIAPSPITAT